MPGQHKRTPRMNRDLARGAKDQRDQAIHDRVERMLSTIINRAQEPTFALVDALIELEEERQIALAVFPPQIMAAVNATKVKCELMGLIVKKTANLNMNANGQIAGMRESEEEIRERLSERLGSASANRFFAALEMMRRAHNGDDDDIIEGDATEIE